MSDFDAVLWVLMGMGVATVLCGTVLGLSATVMWWLERREKREAKP